MKGGGIGENRIIYLREKIGQIRKRMESAYYEGYILKKRDTYWDWYVLERKL